VKDETITKIRKLFGTLIGVWIFYMGIAGAQIWLVIVGVIIVAMILHGEVF